MGELGTLLVRAREARGLTIEDAERDTRISRRYLQALESEQFDVIPAPVYARGFLRSYSQYLGIDPQEALSMFPRDDDEPPPAPAPHRPSQQQPLSAVGAARPTWRRPTPPRPEQSRREREENRPPRREPPRRDHDPELPLEPVIGVDIGVPAPSRRIKTDPAAQTRSAMIAGVAIAAILVVIVLAFLISHLGGGSSADNTPPGPAGTSTAAAGGALAAPGQLTAAATDAAAASAAADATPGVMPNVVGQTASSAQAAITAAGLKVNQRTQKSSRPKGEVIDQSPGPGSQASPGITAIIIVSDGP